LREQRNRVARLNERFYEADPVEGGRNETADGDLKDLRTTLEGIISPALMVCTS